MLNTNQFFIKKDKEEIYSFANPLYKMEQEEKSMLSFTNPLYLLKKEKEEEKDLQEKEKKDLVKF